MKFINNVLKNDPDYKGLLNDISKDRLPVACTGLSLITKAAVVAALINDTGKKAVVITHDEAAASELKTDFQSMGIKTVNFPLRDYCIGNLTGYSKEYEHKRTDTLSALADGDFSLLTLSIDAAIQLTVPPEILKAARFTLKAGDITDTTNLIDELLNSGYVRSEICEGAGQFSTRGGIFDIFPITSKNPVRIEFWGDEIDSISFFDTETQRRTESIDSIEITPACEVLYNPEELCDKLKSYLKNEKSLTDKQKERLNSDINALENGIQIPPDRYLPLIYPGGETIFDYLGDALVFLSESGSMSERFKSMEIQQSADTESYMEDGFLSRATANLQLSKEDFFACVQGAIILENFPRTS